MVDWARVFGVYDEDKQDEYGLYIDLKEEKARQEIDDAWEREMDKLWA